MSNYLYIPLWNIDLGKTEEITFKNGKLMLINNIPFIFKYYTKTSINKECKYVVLINKVKDEEPRRILDRILTVFKLYRDNYVLSNVIFWEEGYDILPHYTFWKDDDRPKKIYKINQNETDRFIIFWDRYIDISPLIFAVRRFHLADFRPFSQDRFADYVETLEYIYVPDYNKRIKNKGISKRLQERCSKVLGGKNIKTVLKIENDLKNAYGLRSGIVHGDKKKIAKIKGKKNWADITKIIRKYARESIKYFHDQSILEDINQRKIFLKSL